MALKPIKKWRFLNDIEITEISSEKNQIANELLINDGAKQKKNYSIKPRLTAIIMNCL